MVDVSAAAPPERFVTRTDGASRVPESAQTGPHRQFAALLARRAGHAFCKPVAAYSVDAFARFAEGCAPDDPLIVDSCCGIGESTLHLAQRHPDHFVLGVDQSSDRLSRAPVLPGNALIVRADMTDMWRLLHEGGYRPAQQFMLYPNPWPKAAHLARRWPAHAIFPTVLALGGRIECRSNWRIYIEEFVLAVRVLGGVYAQLEVLPGVPPMTPFERKYRASGHELYRCAVRLPPD